MKNKFRLNSNKKVMAANYDLVRPGLSHGEYIIRSLSFSEAEEAKLELLRAKYKVSRSALFRILLASAE